MAVRYEYWRHKVLGETYAVRLQDGKVTGVLGPLDGTSVDRTALPYHKYDANPDRCRCLEDRGSEFLLL
jgi:hypothetical protein